MSKLGEFVKARRVELGLSQVNAAAKVDGLGQSLFNRLEAGRAKVVTKDDLEMLAEALEVSLSDLFTCLPGKPPVGQYYSIA